MEITGGLIKLGKGKGTPNRLEGPEGVKGIALLCF
jgi:hypothetical protein